MSATKEGGIKAAKTNKDKYGQDFYSRIGKIGGSRKVPKGFSMMTTEQRQAAGKVGGTRSKRGPA